MTAHLELETALKRKKLSKRQFAKRLGIAYHNVFRIFHATHDPRFSALNRYAKALGCRVRDLFKD